MQAANKKKILSVFIFSLAVGCFCALGQMLSDADPSVIIEKSVTTVFVTLVIILGMLFLVSQYDLKTKKRWTGKLNSAVLMFVLFLVAYSAAFLTYFPGTAYNDTTQILMNGMMMGNQYPVIFCFVMVVVAKSGALFGSLKITFATYCFIQVIIVSALTVWICRWIQQKKIPTALKVISIAYFLLNPLFGIYSVSVIKDTLFSIALIVLTALFFDIMVEEKNVSGHQWGLFSFCELLLYSYRNNGLYVLVPLLVIMFIKKKEYRKQVVWLFAELIVLFTAVKMLSNRFDIVPLFKESLAIPLQQIAATVYNDGVITEDQLAFIDKMLPVEMIRENYDASYADPIKWSPYFNDVFISENKLEFFRVWFGLLVHNFKIYVVAYLKETFWFWFPADSRSVLIVNWLGGVPQEWLNTRGLVLTPVFKGSLLDAMQSYYESARFIPCEGICVWVMFGCAFLRKITGKKKAGLAFLPCILLWITLMISTPISSGTRYILPLMYGVPVFFTMLFAGNGLPAEQN